MKKIWLRLPPKVTVKGQPKDSQKRGNGRTSHDVRKNKKIHSQQKDEVQAIMISVKGLHLPKPSSPSENHTLVRHNPVYALFVEESMEKEALDKIQTFVTSHVPRRKIEKIIMACILQLAQKLNVPARIIVVSLKPQASHNSQLNGQQLTRPIIQEALDPKSGRLTVINHCLNLDDWCTLLPEQWMF